MATQKLTNEIINAAIDGFEAQKTRINAQIAELRQMLDGSGSEPPAAPAPKKRRTMSAAGRKRIIAATKKRWALISRSSSRQRLKSA